MNSGKKELDKDKVKLLKGVIGKYTNYYKALHHINPAAAEDFKNKQEYYYQQLHKHNEHDDTHDHGHHDCQYEYESVTQKAKYTKILSSGLQQGMTVNKESERELMHRLLLEGIPFYISSLLKTKLKQYEESISEQPMLLAHPSSVNDKSMLNFIPKQNIEEIIKSNYTVIPSKIYIDLPQYELYSQFRYLYMQGEFEDESIKDNNHRSDFIFNFHINYFEKSKHKLITKLTHCLYALPFELNNNYPMFQCQVNDYVQCSYFRENFSYVNVNYDSSFTHDTGKKFTYMVVLFPDEVELNKRILNIKLHDNNNNNNVYDIKLTEPLSAVLIKSRKIGYEIPKHTFPFILMFYYIHGPIDKDNFTC